jgi:hypothetical protein
VVIDRIVTGIRAEPSDHVIPYGLQEPEPRPTRDLAERLDETEFDKKEPSSNPTTLGDTPWESGFYASQK